MLTPEEAAMAAGLAGTGLLLVAGGLAGASREARRRRTGVPAGKVPFVRHRAGPGRPAPGERPDVDPGE